MEDSVTRAKQEREKQGPWEVEVSFAGEADLHQHLKSCDKNPGHQKFVPVDQFNVDHLPPGCHDNDLVDYVRAVSDLTVRVSVKYVSNRRPETVHGRPYPNYKERGSDIMRVGTGCVWRVYKYPDEVNFHGSCPCQECRNSPTPKTKFAHIIVNTATHVVYDNMEAAHTTCHLFFDKGGTPDACSNVVTLTGLYALWNNVVTDFCELKCVTHDLDLADKLSKMAKHLRDFRKRILDKYVSLKPEKLESSSPVEEQPDATNKLTIIVSHPHGCSKQVSVGCWTKMFEDKWNGCGRSIALNDYNDSSFTYTTATCPGSSGAYVIVLNRELLYHRYNIVHCGGTEEDKNVNFCRLPYPT